MEETLRKLDELALELKLLTTEMRAANTPDGAVGVLACATQKIADISVIHAAVLALHPDDEAD